MVQSPERQVWGTGIFCLSLQCSGTLPRRSPESKLCVRERVCHGPCKPLSRARQPSPGKQPARRAAAAPAEGRAQFCRDAGNVWNPGQQSSPLEPNQGIHPFGLSSGEAQRWPPNPRRFKPGATSRSLKKKTPLTLARSSLRNFPFAVTISSKSQFFHSSTDLV